VRADVEEDHADIVEDENDAVLAREPRCEALGERSLEAMRAQRGGVPDDRLQAKRKADCRAPESMSPGISTLTRFSIVSSRDGRGKTMAVSTVPSSGPLFIGGKNSRRDPLDRDGVTFPRRKLPMQRPKIWPVRARARHGLLREQSSEQGISGEMRARARDRLPRLHDGVAGRASTDRGSLWRGR
jgi:hypothetical protein